MATLLKRARMFSESAAKDRLKSALRVVALEVAGEQLASSPTSDQLATYRKRQSVSRHWLDATNHWANDVSEALSGASDLDQYAKDLSDESLGAARETAMDAALLAAVRTVFPLYLDRVSL